MSKRVLIQSSLLPKMALIEVPDDATLADVRREALQLIPPAKRHESLHVTFEDAAESSSAAHGKESTEVVDGLRAHVSACKKVMVNVRYFGKTASRDFAAAVRLKVVKDWAVKEFSLADAEAARHSLRLPNAQEELSADVHLGSLAEEGTCSVTLDLLPSDRINGA